MEAAMAPPELEPIPESVNPIPEESNLPARIEEEPQPRKKEKPPKPKKEKKPREPKEPGPPLWLGASAMVLVGVLLLGALVPLRAQIMALWPAMAGAYQMAGFKIPIPGDGLIFDGVRASVVQGEDGADVLAVQGNIVNLRNKPVILPPLRATLRREDGKAGDTWLLDLKEKSIEPQGTLPFMATRAGTGHDSKEVNLRFDPAE